MASFIARMAWGVKKGDIELVPDGRYTYAYTYRMDFTMKKLTITVDPEVYAGLHSVIGRRRISRFLNDLARPLVVGQGLAAGYAAMAADEAREAEAESWAETLITDSGDEPRRG